MACKGEVGYIIEVGGGKFTPDTVEGTRSVACKVEIANPGYFTFEQGGMSRINWRSIGKPGSDIKTPLRGKTVPDPRKVSTTSMER